MRPAPLLRLLALAVSVSDLAQSGLLCHVLFRFLGGIFMSVEKKRSRCWNFVLYPDDPSHVVALDFIRQNYKYVLICHDKDLDSEGNLKKPHYHIICKFGQARWNSSIADELGITPNYMQSTGSWDNSARYLLHDGCDNKYQYEASALEGPLAPAVERLLQNDDENVRVIAILDLLNSLCTFVTLQQFIRLVCEKGLYSDWRRMGYNAIRLLDEHNQLFWKDDFLDV